MTKTVFIIAGFHHKASEPQYKWMRNLLEKQGFIVKAVPIRWNRYVMSDWVEEFEAFYAKNRSDKNYVLGFSFGAMIAFISAQNLQPDRLLLCSLSSYFAEDLPKVKSTWKKVLGSRRIKDFKKFNARSIAPKLPIPTTVFCGAAEGREFPELKLRCEETAKLLPRGKLVMVKDAPHKIDHPEYMKAIEKAFS